MKRRTKRNYFKDEELLKQIGDRIREVRVEKEISQEMLANEAEVDYSQVNRMELGKVNFSISTLSRIAKALQTDLKELLS